jgi:hypothetical protein
MNKGFTHKQTTLIIYGINIILGIVAVLSTQMTDGQALYTFCAVVVVLILSAWIMGLIKVERNGFHKA